MCLTLSAGSSAVQLFSDPNAEFGYAPSVSSTAGSSTYTQTNFTDSLLLPGDPLDTNGSFMTDTFCTGTASSCITDFNFFYVTNANWIPYKTSGILGLAPQSDGSPPSLAQALKSAGLISDAEATLWLSNNSTESSLTFGAEPAGVTSGKYRAHSVQDVSNQLGEDLWVIELEQWNANGTKQTTNTTHAVVEPSSQMAMPINDWQMI
jgi:hypothetical protein